MLTAGIAAVCISGAVQERSSRTGQPSTSMKGVWRAVEQTTNDRVIRAIAGTYSLTASRPGDQTHRAIRSEPFDGSAHVEVDLTLGPDQE